MGGEPPINVESPYKRTVSKDLVDAEDFEICHPRERVISRMPFRKKILYIHLKEDEDGGTMWDILQVGSGEPERYQIGQDD